ncbi:hypothetical protein VB712_13950 [Spirulina sp. CCNP1310]|uniref:hypothetical protein n=1 Tax=Spirulina sp. CCNP1310 TaxID=3110249 RepID=UPI002B218DEB|nr:hypothetical protein [Spirulina sp. CCNP1310]MEA5420330.1 hypothetical protein [Spirulina sp. CCNP1310]
MNTALFPNAPDVQASDYCVFGLATCFIREDGEVKEVQVVEPIPSAALQALFKGIPTSYQYACGKPLGEFFEAENLQMPPEFPPPAQFCENFAARTVAAARTYQRSQQAQTLIPVGTQKADFNFSTERKRVLNADNIVSTEDNVKQHSYTHQVL